MLATQVHPFSQHKGLSDLLYAIGNVEIDYSSISDPGFVSLLQKMLTRDPDERASMRELLKDEWLGPVDIYEGVSNF